METWPGISQRCFTEKDILILSLHLGDRVKRLNNLNSDFRKSIFQGVFGRLFKKLGCIAAKKNTTVDWVITKLHQNLVN